MSKIDRLLDAYERFVALPWAASLSGPEKVWFCIYDPRDERRLRVRIPAFEAATRKAGHRWALFEVTGRFERWMANHEYRESYFARPKRLSASLDRFRDALAAEIGEVLAQGGPDDVVAIAGVGELLGITRVHQLVESVAGSTRGRLVVFFPGKRTGNNYRLLDARDGWNYLAVPIEAEENLAT